MAATHDARAVSEAEEPWSLDCCGLTEAYSQGLSPVDVMRSCLSQVQRLNPLLNAFVLVTDAEAAAQESAARWRAGAACGPLDGVPIAVKDNLAVAGMPATWGSRLFSEQLWTRDELPIARLRSAGAIILGKVNTPEFAVEGYTANELFGVTRNPWRPELTPGGSSGGAVAAVASGMTPAAIGTDGGGSIRRPAAYTNLVGLKPSIGRVPRGGGLPQLLLDFEVVGPLTRTVRDAELFYDVLAGPDRQDSRSRLIPIEAPYQSPLRILYVEALPEAPCDPVIRQRVGQAAQLLCGLGHAVESGPLPFELAELNEFWPIIASVGLARLRRDEPDFAAKAGRKYVELADIGDAVPAPQFAWGLQQIEALRQKVSLAFERWDVIMTPACAAMPWAAEQPFPKEIDGQPVGPRGHAVYTGWVNAAGHPAIVLPCDPSPDGLPIGFQLVGDLGSERLLLALSQGFEQVRPWADRWPSIVE